MSRVLLALILFSLAAPLLQAQGVSADSPSVLTLDSAILEARQNNRLIKISNQNVLLAKDEILAAKTQRYPQFNVNFTASGLLTPISVDFPRGVFGIVDKTPVPTSNSVVTTDPKVSALSYITAYQPLTQLYNVHLNVQLLKVGEQLSQEQLRQQRQEITNSVKEVYYGLLQTQSALEAANENVKALREVDRTTEQYAKEKTVLQYQSSGEIGRAHV